MLANPPASQYGQRELIPKELQQRIVPGLAAGKSEGPGCYLSLSWPG